MAVISKGSYTAVVHHQGRYYAANKDTKTINVLELHADQWKQINSFSIYTDKCSFISLGILKNLIYVCSSSDSRIDAYTLNGVQFITGERGNKAPGELYWPRICDTEASGSLLIVDSWNDRLQVMSAYCQWSIMQLDPHVKKPQSACLVNDTLYVNHLNENGNWFISSYKSE